MSIAAIGGLRFSTVLSLVFVPAVFAVMDLHRPLCWPGGCAGRGKRAGAG
jgi:hypothetical protein